MDIRDDALLIKAFHFFKCASLSAWWREQEASLAGFPHDRCDRWKKCSAIAAIIWKHYRNDRSDRWDRARVYLGDREFWMEPLSSDRQLSQNAFQTIQNCCFHGRNSQNTTVYTIRLAKIIKTSTRYWTAGQRLQRNASEVRLKQRRNSKTSEQRTISWREFANEFANFKSENEKITSSK